MNTKLSKLVLAMGALVMAGGAFAADTQTTMTTTAVVPEACVISNASTIALGTLTMLDASVSATHNTAEDSVNTGTFKATCTNGTAGALFSYTSAHASTTTPTGFTMTTGDKGADETMVYSLYPSTDASGTALVETIATAHPSFTATGVQQTLNLSVEILAAEKATKKVGSYTDTVTINVTFGAAG